MSSQPEIFVASSTEGIAAAEALKTLLAGYADVKTWRDVGCELSVQTADSILSTLKVAKFGIFILSDDDDGSFRGKKCKFPRANVIFELGAFVGIHSMKKAFVVRPTSCGLSIPSDLDGVSCATYTKPQNGDWITSLRPAAEEIGKLVEKFRETKEFTPDISWEELCNDVEEIGAQMLTSPHRGGFMPDAFIGISRGGLIVADLLARYMGGTVPVLSLWSDRNSVSGESSFTSSRAAFNSHTREALFAINGNNILLVDDISRTGTTVTGAKKFLKKRNNSKSTIKTLVLYLAEESTFKPDFSSRIGVKKQSLLPFSRLG